MNRSIALVLSIANLVAALAVLPVMGLGHGLLRLNVLSTYAELRSRGVINYERLKDVASGTLLPDDEGKVPAFLIGRYPEFNHNIGVVITGFLCMNGLLCGYAYARARKGPGGG